MRDEDLIKSWQSITDLKATQILTDWRLRRFLDPFLEAPRTMSEVGALLTVKLNVVHYRVKQLVRLGLLQVVGTRKDVGRPAKLYGVTAEKFFVSFSNTTLISMEDMLNRLGALDVFIDNAAQTLNAQASDWGVLIFHDPLVGVTVKLAPLDQEGVPKPIDTEQWLRLDFPALLQAETFLYLDIESAKHLQADLISLLRSYTNRKQFSGQNYILLLGITPVQQHR